ncbi:uncharacterized protein LOC105420750 [Amborella trichopoda]|uniref:uncharacterized protein LOC105420750 n=1 Tax=Amborella trichopoda TaxID=13333 RepID=UPI0005D435B7|nr:uncharacterized protein LOC105420750 [Amborella trichopoda]|eukprot:XP_011623911.1 uncharacterized protein LOC105420750 [Amborella trichopoda]
MEHSNMFNNRLASRYGENGRILMEGSEVNGGLGKRSLKEIKIGIWKVHEEGLIKLNFDGSFSGNLRPAGIRGLIRDHDGRIVLTFYGLARVITSNETELRVVLQRLKLVKSLSKPVVIECDLMNVIKWIIKEWSYPWVFHEQVPEIMDCCGSLNASFVHVFKECNMEANALAKAGVNAAELVVV